MADYNEAIRLDPKFAQAFNGRGNTYSAKGDLDRAMADYNEAIRLDPKYAHAFNGRGNTYSAKGDLDRAMADYNEAIRLDPKYAHAFNGRGNTYSAKGDLDRAMADYNEAIRLDPKYGRGYLNRGIAYLYSGNLVKALADESQANAVRPKDAYAALWLDIIGQRNNVPSNLSQAISQIDMTAWPAPVLRMFLGQLTRAAVLAAANDPDANKKTGQVCEANFYSGELALRAGGKDEATRLFQLASSGCPKDFREYYAANAELKALGVTP
jgi:lipoprotein NlpI